MTWNEFKGVFIARYGSVETTAAFFTKLLHNKPKDGECLADYGATTLSSILAKCKCMSMEEIGIAMVVAHIAQFEQRIYHLAYTTDIKTRSQMQNELQARTTSFKRIQGDRYGSEDGPHAKQFKPVAAVGPKCYGCGQRGHKVVDCNKNDVTRKIKIVKEVECYRCHQKGHYASKCPNEKANIHGVTSERRVNLCRIDQPTGLLHHQGKEFKFCFDSVAECSIVKENIANKPGTVTVMTFIEKIKI